MARYTGPREKIERRLGTKLGLKGARSLSPKSATVKRMYPPGAHGKARPRKLSEFGEQLKSKQRVRHTYRIMERQFKGYVKKALAGKDPVSDIASSLEQRLDNVVYRAGFATSRDQARQLVGHGHVTVNGKRVSIPSYRVRQNDIIGIREQSKASPYFTQFIPQWLASYQTPAWLAVDKTQMTAQVNMLPGKTESGLENPDLQAIVEYYSR